VVTAALNGLKRKHGKDFPLIDMTYYSHSSGDALIS
jgi:hypothetical protein